MYIYMCTYRRKRVTGLQGVLVVKRASQQMKNMRTSFYLKLCSTPVPLVFSGWRQVTCPTPPPYYLFHVRVIFDN